MSRRNARRCGRGAPRLRAVIDDPREPWRVVHPLREVLLLVVCASMADRDVSRAVAFAQAGLILGEDDVENPVQLIFYAPQPRKASPARFAESRADDI